MKRAVIVQSYKIKTRITDENTFYIFDILKKNIKERDKEKFQYKGETSNFFILNEKKIANTGNTAFYKFNKEFYQIKFHDSKLRISSAETPKDFKKYDTLATLDSLIFQSENNLLFITYEINGKITEQVINLK